MLVCLSWCDEKAQVRVHLTISALLQHYSSGNEPAGTALRDFVQFSVDFQLLLVGPLGGGKAQGEGSSDP